MTLTILSVSYPLAPVSPDAVGGAEQVLSALDRALVGAGHRSVVIAPEGSRVAGTLLPVPAASGVLDDGAKLAAQARHREAIAAALERYPVDLVHLHGIDFDHYLPAPGPAVLATLHLPLAWYPADALAPARPRTSLHCVSERQQDGRELGPAFLPPIPNGVDLAAFGGPHAKRCFALILGRVCPEKGVHLALEAAHRAGVPLLVAGQVYPYREHLDYFDREVRPLLDGQRRFLGPVGGVRKRRLLAAARCLLVPSLAPETSSLVAREALASGTPVVAFPAGALADTVAHGRTGFLVEDAAAMADAIRSASAIDPEACREAARTRFSADRMVAAYLSVYRQLAERAA